MMLVIKPLLINKVASTVLPWLRIKGVMPLPRTGKIPQKMMIEMYS